VDRFVLEALFIERGHSHVVLVEDDMIFSRDFALYFEQLAPLLDQYTLPPCLVTQHESASTSSQLSRHLVTHTCLFGVVVRDPSLWCVSSWNDNGFVHLVEDSSRLFRTDYFPGLGWMLTRRLWDEVQHLTIDDYVASDRLT
jgi:alpha-1,3-mannosyl-glycoprotein beta-1,2-N-acetylglucosaminyltransferase